MNRKAIGILALVVMLLLLGCVPSKSKTETPQLVSFKVEKIGQYSFGNFNEQFGLFVLSINEEKILCVYEQLGYGGGLSCDWAKESEFAKSLNSQ